MTRKLALHAGNQIPANLNTLLAEDDLLHAWYNVGALLCALSEQNRERTGIDLVFFESYREELENIADKHVAVTELVRQHLAERTLGDGTDSSMPREIRDLRDRLYTFIACGVHSSVNTDAQSLEIVKRLGFAVRPSNERETSFVTQLAGLSFAALIVLSVFTGYSAYVFRQSFVLPIDASWQAALPMPSGPLGLYAWSWATATFYFTAIFGALAVRNSRVARRQWFDITNLDRERPIPRYVMPTLVGTGLGALALWLIALIGAPGLSASFSDLGGAAVDVLPWVPLATMMAFISVYLSDSRLKADGFWRSTLVRASWGAAAMIVVGFFTAELKVLGTIASTKQSLANIVTPIEVTHVGHYLSLFIAAQIGVFALVLCVIVQVAERYAAGTRCFAGACVDIATRHGCEFRMCFEASGAASVVSCAQGDAVRDWRGRWQLFPEGTAVRWNIADGESCKAGQFGLISRYGDSLIYEGYADGVTATADFVAQAHIRPSSDAATNLRLLETTKAMARSALPAPPRPEVSAPASDNSSGERAII